MLLFIQCLLYNTFQCCFLLYNKVNQLHIYLYPLFWGVSFLFTSLQSTEQSALCYIALCQTVSSHQLSILYTVMYVCQPQSPNSSHLPPHFVSWCPYTYSLHLCFYFRFVNRFICSIFLYSTYVLTYNIYFSLSELLWSV